MPTLNFSNVKVGDVLELNFGLVPINKNSVKLTIGNVPATLTGTWNEDYSKFKVTSITKDSTIAMIAEAYDDPNLIVFDNLSLGSTFMFGKHQVNSETPWDIEWEIVHQEDDYQIAQTVQIIDVRAFDGIEASNSDSNRKKYGNNNWKLSNIRQWLNSDAAAGTWYSAQHSADAPPTNANTANCGTGYDTRPGFLYHFTAAQKSAMMNFDLTLKIPTVDGGGSHVVSQKVFLPTMTQVGFGANEGVTEGTVFGKYSGSTTADRIKILHPNATANTGDMLATTTAWHWWLSSHLSVSSSHVKEINQAGEQEFTQAGDGSLGLAPCICLPRSGKLQQ